jgi:hypothetical protein
VTLTFDPLLRTLDTAWLDLLGRYGFSVERSPVSWVAYNGRGTISIAPDDLLDDDDSIAQIALHELCHFWVEGPRSRECPDWGLDNTDERHVVREQAALRLQAHLLDGFGLRLALVATTDFRPYYEGLGPSPLNAEVSEPSVDAARQGLQTARSLANFGAVLELLRKTEQTLRGPR